MNHSKLIYITAQNKNAALALARVLVEEKQVACANIISGVTSIFEWEGKLEEAEEVIIIAKTTENKVFDVIKRVKELHEYDCPCVVSLAIEGGNPEFLAWIEKSIKSVA